MIQSNMLIFRNERKLSIITNINYKKKKKKRNITIGYEIYD